MEEELTEKQGRLVKILQESTGLSFDECKEVIMETDGDWDKITKLLEQKAIEKSKDYDLGKISSSKIVHSHSTHFKNKSFVKLAGFVINKVIGSIFSAGLIFVGIGFVLSILQGQKTESIFTFIIKNWIICVGFGGFITLFRLFENDFWKSR